MNETTMASVVEQQNGWQVRVVIRGLAAAVDEAVRAYCKAWPPVAYGTTEVMRQDAATTTVWLMRSASCG